MLDKKATSDDSEATRERILTVSAALIGRKGFHAVGLSELCQAADISRGGFYHLFPSKEDLLEKICQRYSTELLERAKLAEMEEGDPLARIARLGRDLVVVIGKRKDELAVCFRETQFLDSERRESILKILAAYEKAWKDAWLEGAKAGVFVAFSQPRLKALLGMYYYSYTWLDSSKPALLREAAYNFEQIVMSTLKHSLTAP